MTLPDLREGLDFISRRFLLLRMDRAPGSANEIWRRALLNGESAKPPLPSSSFTWKPSYLREDLNGDLSVSQSEAIQEDAPSIDWVLEKALTAVRRYGIRGLVIDPYNELDHSRPQNMSETEYVSSMLSKVKRFAQRYDVHVWFVAHPRQLQDWQGRAPTLYDISGSAHFINKADNGIVVHRDWEDLENGISDGEVKIIVQKVRNKVVGKIGEHKLYNERETRIF